MAWGRASSLTGISLSISLPLLAGFYLVWALILLGMALALWRNRALSLALPIAVIYQLTLWILRVLADRSEYARQAWGREAGLSLAFLAMVGILSFWQRKHNFSNNER